MRVARLLSIVLIGSAAAALLAAGSSRSAPATLTHAPPAFLVGHSASLNWAGYSSFGGNGTFTDVKGSWTQPSATCSNKTSYSSFWVGLDGYNSGSVEQLGTEADCSHGAPVYYAWWEMFPNPSNTIRNFTVTPGHSYTGEVKYNGSGSFTLSLRDNTSGQSFSTTQTLANPSLSSAEWIAEAPSMCAGSCRVLPLTNFGTVSFSGSSANSKPINSTSWSVDPLTMVTNGGQPRAVPSTLDSTGSAFSVAWKHS